MEVNMKNKLIIFTFIIGIVGCSEPNVKVKQTPPPTPTPEQTYESEEDSMLKELYPICVIEVNRSTYKEYKWEVIAENGLMYYTNDKPKIGDPAFYIGSDSETLYSVKDIK